MTYKEIIWTSEEIEYIRQHGEISPAAAHAAMTRSKINFDDIEDINGHHESHRWGSAADRAYRTRAINRAVQHIAANAAAYLPGVDRRAYYNGKILERLKSAVIAYERNAGKECKTDAQWKKWHKICEERHAAYEAAEDAGISDKDQLEAVAQAKQEARQLKIQEIKRGGQKL